MKPATQHTVVVVIGILNEVLACGTEPGNSGLTWALKISNVSSAETVIHAYLKLD